MSETQSAGARLRAAVEAERPLQVVGAINAYAALLAEAAGFGPSIFPAAGWPMPPSACPTSASPRSTTSARTSAASPTPAPCRCWSTSTPAGARPSISPGPAPIHPRRRRRHAHRGPGGAKRCGHRPGKELVPQAEMVDRIKAAVDARTDRQFVIMARTDALAGRRARPRDRARARPTSRPAPT